MKGRVAEPHYWIVDRFEGDLVVVEVDGDRFLDMPRWLVPTDAREGDVIALSVERGEGGAVTIRARIDSEATDSARAEASRLVENLKKKDPGGDIVL